MSTIKSTENLIHLWGSGVAEGREVKSWFTNAAWRLTLVISRQALYHFKGWTDFWRSIGLSTAGKVSLCLCLPTHLHASQLQATAATQHTLHSVQPPLLSHPRSTPTSRDLLQAIWEKFEPHFVLQIPVVTKHHHCLMTKPTFFNKGVARFAQI